jgi:hypothetical protein
VTRALLSVLLTSLIAIFPAAAGADIGSVAKRGDNCTVFNGYAVGFPMSGTRGDTIVDQAVILANGWRAVGWILTLRGERLRLVAYKPGDNDDQHNPGVRGAVDLRSLSKDDIRKTYMAHRDAMVKHSLQPASDFLETFNRFTVSPCFSAPLPRGA